MRKIKIILFFSLLVFSLASCRKDTSIAGQVEGGFSYVNAPAAGVITRMNLHEKQYVEKGQVLFMLTPLKKPRDYKSAIHQLDSAQQAFDRALASNNEKLQYKALDRLSKAESGLTSVKWNKKSFVITAKRSGFIYNVYYSSQDEVPAGAPVISMLPSNDAFIVFFVDKQLLASLNLNQSIEVKTKSGHTLPAEITYISFSPADRTVKSAGALSMSKTNLYRVEAKPSGTEKRLLLSPGCDVQVVL